MPAPDRDPNKQRFTTSIEIPKGLWGYYTDLEIDALLAALPAGGGAVDLSAYATTAYVDGKIATVYTKAEVDAAVAAAIAAIPAPPDLTGLATETFVTEAVAAAVTGGTVDLSAYATNDAVDAAIAAAVAAIPAVDVLKAIEGNDIQPRGVAVGEGGLAFQGVYSFTVENVGIGPRPVVEYRDGPQAKTLVCLTRDDSYTKPEVDAAIAAAAAGDVDLSAYATTEQLDGVKTEIMTAATGAFQERYTKQEVDGLFVKQADLVAPPNLDGYATEQYVDDTIARIPSPDLSAYATTAYVDAAVANATAGGTTDLSAYAKLDDAAQNIKASHVEVVSGVLFDGGNVGLAYTDTGEGHGERLVLAKRDGVEYVVMKSDLAPLDGLIPRVEALESATPAAVDLSAYAKLNDPTQTLFTKGVVADAFAFDLANGLRYIDTGEGYGPRLYFVSNATGVEEKNPLVYVSDLEPLNALFPRIESLESKAAPVPDLGGYVTTTDLATALMVYGKTADVATFVQTNYAAKADTYTKAEVEERLLQVPSGMRYLQWGGAFQKVPAASARDKWFGAGLMPSIQIVKGKRYRLDMTTKFGPFNTDVKECWVGFRFNYRTLNELPCTKQPLVTMSGWGTTTVTRARAAISTTAPATTTPTRADRFRFCCVDDWTSAEDIIEYAVEFEADQDIASANFVPEICFGGSWLTFPTEFIGVVAVFRQMD